MLLTKGKYTIFAIIITTLALTSLWKLDNFVWGSFIFLLYLAFFGYYLGQFILPKQKRIWQILFGAIAMTGLITIFSSATYWFYEINQKVVTIILIVIPILISLQKAQEEDVFENVETEIDLESYSYIKSHLATKLYVLIVLAGDALLFLILYSKQYTDTLISPWTIIGPRFFILFFLITALIFWILQKSKHIASNLLLIITHISLILSVALIIFKYGFGFDPFIHRATETWISKNGSILPKNPYYIGQYMFVIFSNLVSNVSINFIDKILVPISASILVPMTTYFALGKKGYRYKLTPALMTIPFLPLLFFTMTTPNSLALLLAYVLFIWIWYESKYKSNRTIIIGIILSLTICAIHPFIGLPVLFIYLFSLLNLKKTGQALYLVYALILSGILPIAFYLNSLRLGQKLIIKNPFLNLDKFLILFQKPHWFVFEKASAQWKLLYYYRSSIKPIVITLIIVGIIIVLKKYKDKKVWFFISSSIGLFISAFLLATTIEFADVISYEQGVYSSRILEMTLILLLPFFVIATREMFLLLRKQPKKQILLALLASSLILISWYFTYPTRDQVSLHTGYNVRATDVKTVNFIDNKNNNQKDYIVLTNQTVSAAALQEFSFAQYFKNSTGEHYFYSIPTGGPLYQFFRKMVYEEPKREWMEQAMQFAGVKKAYFVHTNYWAPAAIIRDQAKLEADEWWELDNGRVWVYEYILD